MKAVTSNTSSNGLFGTTVTLYPIFINFIYLYCLPLNKKESLHWILITVKIYIFLETVLNSIWHPWSNQWLKEFTNKSFVRRAKLISMDAGLTSLMMSDWSDVMQV